MKRKLMVLMLAAITAVVLAGCNDDKKQDESAKQAESEITMVENISGDDSSMSDAVEDILNDNDNGSQSVADEAEAAQDESQATEGENALEPASVGSESKADAQ